MKIKSKSKLSCWSKGPPTYPVSLVQCQLEVHILQNIVLVLGGTYNNNNLKSMVYTCPILIRTFIVIWCCINKTEWNELLSTLQAVFGDFTMFNMLSGTISSSEYNESFSHPSVMLNPSSGVNVMMPNPKYPGIFISTIRFSCAAVHKRGTHFELLLTLTRHSCAPVQGCKTCNHSNHRHPHRRLWCCAASRAGRPAPSGLWNSLSDTPEGRKTKQNSEVKVCLVAAWSSSSISCWPLYTVHLLTHILVPKKRFRVKNWTTSFDLVFYYVIL